MDSNKHYKIIKDILEIIGYEEDKDAFAENFFNLCQAKAVDRIIMSAPKEEREELETKIKEDNSYINIVAEKYINKERYLKEVEEVTIELFSDYIKNVIPELTEEEKLKLKEYMSQYSD